jgi:hypothetical protein
MRAIYLALLPLCFISSAYGESDFTCTDTSSARECYEAALSLVGKTIANLRAKEAELDSKLAAISVPSSAVMAFDRNDGCPPGWRNYTTAMGRMIVGADPPDWTPADARNRDELDKPLSPRPFKAPGGAESLRLDADNIPSLDIVMSNRDGELFFVRGWASRNDDNHQNMVNLVPQKPDSASLVSSRTMGKGLEKKYMPPFIALYFCIKQ